MSQEVTPIFTSHHSAGESILTLEKDKEIQEHKPVSILAIGKTHNLPRVVVVDSDFAGYWKGFKNAKELGVKLVYGIKLAVCSNLEDKSPEGQLTESNVIVLFKNDQAYYDFVPIYSLASTIGKTKYRRIDWQSLNSMWTSNFKLLLPFYSSFVAKNLLRYGACAMPDFSNLSPTFMVEQHGLPFDLLIEDAVRENAARQNIPILNTHQVYYYNDADVVNHQSFLCIEKRSSLTKPNLDHYGSDQFSYESCVRRNS